MGYFNNPRTNEELDEQCKRLLLKYDYRSGKNRTVTDAILKEYKEAQMKIARANGYRTIGEKAVSAISQARQEIRAEQQKEQQRVDRLKNHHYTKEETQSLILECKKLIADILKADAQKGRIGGLEGIVSHKDDEYVTRWFNTHTNIMASESQRQAYDRAREKLEYALKGAARNKKTQETYMLQSEKLFGAFIKKKFREYQNIYGDPILIAQVDSVRQQEAKNNKWCATSLSIIPGMFIVTITMLIMSESGSAAGMLIGLLFSTAIGIIIAIPLRKLILSLFRKSYNGLGERKRRSRVTEKNQYEKTRLTNSIFGLILRLLGL